MPVSLVFENLQAGVTMDEIVEWFHLSHEQVRTVLAFAARSLDPAPLVVSDPSTTGEHAHPL